ncbi:MAG: hypothetical protein ABFD16_04265 [Thermoguttaceae bacterium]
MWTAILVCFMALPVPDATAQARAEQLAKQVYGKRIQDAKTPEEKAKLAGEIHRVATEETDPANKYVSLQMAKRLAVEVGNGGLGLEIVQTLVAAFDLAESQSPETLLATADMLWDEADKKKGADKLAGQLAAVEFRLRAGTGSPLVAAKWQPRMEQIKATSSELVLQARDTKVVGTEMLYLKRIDCTCNWHDPREYVEWRATLQAGTYDTKLKYSSRGAGGGYQFAVSVFRGRAPRPVATATFVVSATGGWEDFSETPAGRLIVREDGDYAIRIQAIKKIRTDQSKGLLNIRSLRLEKN